MIGTKRAYNTKLKDILTSPRSKLDGKSNEVDISSIPVIRQSENATQLPTYSSVLSKPNNDGVSMEDLDELQHDLEILLSTSAVRIRHFMSEIASIDKVEENRDPKERTSHDKSSLKRKRIEDKSKYKDKSGARLLKKQYLPSNSYTATDPHHELTKVILPKNEHSDKFWASIEPYCRNVTNDDMAYLDSLIDEFSKDVNINIPEIGEHYSNEWSDECINDELNMGRSPKSKSGVDLKKNGINAIVDNLPGPLTQRLLAALIEERVINTFPSVTDKQKQSDLKTVMNPRVGICMDRMLRKELEDLSKTIQDDEIMAEIKKCQQELITVNKYNLDELNKLKSVIADDLEKQEVKGHLEKIDRQILDIYAKLQAAKKQVAEMEDDSDEETLARQTVKDLEIQADVILKKQASLQIQLSNSGDSVLF